MSGFLRLSKVKFMAGPSPSRSHLEISPSTVVVFVGPNNSGKSLALREIEEWCVGNNAIRKVIEDVEAEFPTDQAEGEQLLKTFKTQPPADQIESPDHLWVGQHTFRTAESTRHYQVNLSQVRSAIAGQDVTQLRALLLRPYTVRLDGRTRFALSDPKPTGDLLLHPQNHLWALFQNDAAREKVRELTEEAFGLYFVVDPTGMTNFRIRMSERAPSTKSEEQALDETARQFHTEARLVSELSDGVQAFTGLISAVMSLPHKVMLIDEPEAFLHPPLARRLGSNLASLATERGASLLVATHSADFLMGCIESTPDTTIVRLTYERDIATARALSATELRDLMLDPLLRSTRALLGLFHRAVVISESDSDRSFYDEINRRLDVVGRGLGDALFINAQNWQTIPRVAGPLRRIGIPAAAIMDLDVLCESTGWPAIYQIMSVDSATQATFEQRRQVCAAYLTALPPTSSGKKAYKVSGINALSGAQVVETQTFIDDLSQYGIFLVYAGELESWLGTMRIAGNKTQWLMNAFLALGSDPGSSSYIQPGHDDVWAFLDKVASWTRDPARKGIP